MFVSLDHRLAVSLEQVQEQVDKLPIPYSFSDMAGVQHPAVSSSSSVFFAVNPSLAMFKGFASGCLSRGMVWQTQLSALSSYAPIRVWKIDPFAYCPHGDDGSDNCGLGRVHFADIPGAFTEVAVNGETQVNVFDIRKCSIPFAVSVTGLEYVNDENIAVTVLWAAFDEYDPFTGLLAPNATKATYKVLFLSTETMGLSETPWSREASMSSAASEGMLCPAMRRLPNLGSLTTELVVAGIEIARKVVDIGISLAGLIEIWGKQQSCSLVTHGHSLLRRCGSDLLSLDNFFEAINRANAHFWRSFSLVSERIRNLDADVLANIVDGVAYYGEATISPLDAYKSVVSTMRIPTQVPRLKRAAPKIFSLDVHDYWLGIHGSTSGTLLGTNCTPNLSCGRIEVMQVSHRSFAGGRGPVHPGHHAHGKPGHGQRDRHLRESAADGPVLLRPGHEHRGRHHPAGHPRHPGLEGPRGGEGDPGGAQQQDLPSEGCLLRGHHAGHDSGTLQIFLFYSHKTAAHFSSRRAAAASP